MAELRVLRTYRYINKNPIIDRMRTALQNAGVGVEKRRLQIAADISGLSRGCLHGLFHGGTRNPQHRTVAGIMTAFGYEEEWRLKRKIDIEAERKIAADWLLKQEANKKRGNAKSKAKGAKS
jgi:hypothetical protein